MLLLLLFMHWFHNVLGDCGYVDLSATVGKRGSFSFPVGEFILSENKCQSLSAQLDIGGSQSIDGAIKFSCDSADKNTLIINEYDNVLCTGEPSQSSSIKVGEDLNIFNDNLYFALNTLVCSDTDCGVDITFSTDCRGVDAMGYSHISIPPNSCQTFGDDFNNMILKQVPYEIFPDATVDGLFNTALEFTCCANDHSLLIFNYSDSNCLPTTAYNTLRLSNTYNGQCFVLGNTQKPFDINSLTEKAATEDIDHNDEVYALRYIWSCDELVDCTGIEFMDETQIPNVCPDKCLETGYSFAPTSSPTMSPTMHPVSNTQHVYVTVEPQNMLGNDEDQELTVVIKYFVIGMVIVLGAAVVAGIVYTMYFKRKFKGAVDADQQKTNSRLEPMIDDNVVEPALINVTDKNNDDNTKESKGSAAGEYVLSSNTTSDQADTDLIIKRSSFIM